MDVNKDHGEIFKKERKVYIYIYKIIYTFYRTDFS